MNSDRKAKFVARENLEKLTEDYLFNNMSHKIAAEAHISPNIVKSFSKAAFCQWEERTGRSIQNLFSMQSVDRSANIYAILNDLRDSLSPIIMSVKRLDKTMCIASVSMELMFNPT